MRSVEVSTVDEAVWKAADMTKGVSHAAVKAAEREAKGMPIPGQGDAMIYISLAKTKERGAQGVIEISANGDRVLLTRNTPPKPVPMDNIKSASLPVPATSFGLKRFPLTYE